MDVGKTKMLSNNKRTFTNSLISKVFLVLIMACLALIAYGVYMYVQDHKDSNVPTLTSTESLDSLSESTKQEIEPESAESFQNLDDQIKHNAKANLMVVEKIMQDEEDLTNISATIAMDISFSSYDPIKRTFNVGIVFMNDQAMSINNCSLEIQVDSSQIASQETDVVGQYGASGCRFNDVVLNLNNLPEPSQLRPWRVTIKGNNQENHELATLERNILSINDLAALIN